MAEEETALSVEETHPVVILEWPKKVTEPCARFILSSTEVFSLMQTLGNLAQGQESMLRNFSRDENYRTGLRENYRHFRATAENRDELPEEFDVGPLMEMLFGSIRRAEEIVAPHFNLLNQMFLTRAVDNFNIYLAELLLLMYRTKLGGAKPRATDIEEFVGRLAEQYVEGASLGGMKRLPGEFKETFGVKLFQSRQEKKKIERIITRRNIITHNRGIANRYFLKQVPDAGLKVGDPVPFIWGDVRLDVVFLLTFVQELDKRVAERFSLPRIMLPPLQPAAEATSEMGGQPSSPQDAQANAEEE